MLLELSIALTHLPGRLLTTETVRLRVCVAQDSAQLEELISLAKNGRSKHHGHSSRSVEYWAPDDW